MKGFYSRNGEAYDVQNSHKRALIQVEFIGREIFNLKKKSESLIPICNLLVTYSLVSGKGEESGI